MSSTITDNLLRSISYLDAFCGAEGLLSSNGRKMISNPSNSNIVNFLSCLGNSKEKIGNQEKEQILLKNIYDSLLPFLGKLKIKEITKKIRIENEEPVTFDSLYSQLNSLIGLQEVKKAVNNLIAYHKIQQIRKKAGLKIPNKTLHISFMGNPGTGKTTVARILGKMYKELGLLSIGHFTEVSRTDLIAGYQGQTALKVKEVIEQAKGGVLFIDEAYSLTENDNSDSYGRECLTELTKALEDYRNDLVVIVAGYTELMKAFFDSNPGLRSRFNTFIEFKDYQSSELLEMLIQMAASDDYIIDNSAEILISSILEKAIADKNENFSNGRYVRNLYEKAIMHHANRLENSSSISDDDLRILISEDFNEIECDT